VRLRNIAIVAGAVGLSSSTSAIANDLFSNGTFTVGVGAFYSSSTYKSDKAEVSPFPFVAYDSDRLHLGFDGISYKLINRDVLKFSIKVAPGENPDFPKNNPLFSGLKRGTPIEAGFDGVYQFDTFYVSGGALVDVSSEHDGYQAHAKVGTEFTLGSLGVDIGGGVNGRPPLLRVIFG
jgi:outer membrane protein